MDVLERVRRREHTGERRCWPCTVLNAAVVAVAAVAVGAIIEPVAALAVAVVGLAAVWVRGYLVPYTPQFAPRVAAALPGDAFDHDAGPSPGSIGRDAPGGEELLADLRGAGVVTVEGDRLVPTARFEADWHDEMAALRDRETAALAESALAVSSAADATTDDDGEWVVLAGESGAVEDETWLSRPVAIAEVAAVHALDGRVDDPETRRAAAGPLRLFLKECPDCAVPLAETTTAACCGAHTDPRSAPDEVLACPACDARVATLSASDEK